MVGTRDPRAPNRSDIAPVETRSLESGQTRLAHWPPPYRSVQVKPIIIKHPPGEVPKRAKPRGWRITRAMFSEFEEE